MDTDLRFRGKTPWGSDSMFDGLRIKSMSSSEEQELLASAVRSGLANGDGAESTRRAIRELCLRAAQQDTRDQLLITFRTSLNEAADQAAVPAGPKREALLARLAAIFVQEFYSVPRRRETDGENRQPIG